MELPKTLFDRTIAASQPVGPQLSFRYYFFWYLFSLHQSMVPLQIDIFDISPFEAIGNKVSYRLLFFWVVYPSVLIPLATVGILVLAQLLLDIDIW